MKAIRTIPLAIIIVAMMIAGIGISKITGYWRTTSSKEPAKFTSGENAGVANPADIRGSYTWQDIEKAFGIPAAEIAAAFSSAGDVFEVSGKVNALAAAAAALVPEANEIGTDSVRLFVALYKKLPYDPEESTVLLPAAVAALIAAGIRATDIEKYELPEAASAVPVAATAPSASTPASTPAAATAAAPSAAPAADHAAPANTVTGKTTFGELYGWGLTPTQVEGARGFKPGPSSQSVRDGISAEGASFSELKTKLQALLDAKKP